MYLQRDSVVTPSLAISLPTHAMSAAVNPSSATSSSSVRPPSIFPPIRQGAAILRDGACLPDIEFDCGLNFPLRACCPSALTCRGKETFRCCAPRTNCGSERLCANSSWNLFDNEGYFCCDSNAAGYNVGNRQACLGLGTSVSGAILLRTLTVDPAATPSTLKSTSPSKSSSNAGIVGAILGSIVGFAVIVRVTWIMLRLRQQKGIEILVDITTGRSEEVAEDMRRSRQFMHEHNPEPGAQSASFELQWSTMQPASNMAPRTNATLK